MKCVSKYRDMDKLKAYRKRNRKRYYRDSGGKRKPPYTEDEDMVIMLSDETDREIAQEFGRSIKSIQMRRTKLRLGRVANRSWVNYNKKKNTYLQTVNNGIQ